MQGHLELIKKVISKQKLTSKVLLINPKPDINLKSLSLSHQIDVLDKNIEILNYYATQGAKNIFASLNGGLLPIKTEEYELVIMFPNSIESVKSQVQIISEINRISKKSLIFFQNGATLKKRLNFLFNGTIDTNLQETLTSKRYFSYSQIQYLTYKSGFTYEICFAKVGDFFISAKKLGYFFTLKSEEFAFYRDSENTVKITSGKSLLNIVQP
jgi:hypothetical protein